MLQFFAFVVEVSMGSLVRTPAVTKSTRKQTMGNKCVEKSLV